MIAVSPGLSANTLHWRSVKNASLPLCLLGLCFMLVSLLLIAPSAHADKTVGKTGSKLEGTQLTLAPTHLGYKPRPRIAIIIDDIGYNRKAGEKAISLPGALTYAVIPFTPFGRTLAEQAYFSDKEVMLHLPMESTTGRKLDIGGITTRQSKWEVKDRVKNSLNRLPFAVGFNNHMGSMLTADEKAMSWIMEEVAGTPLFFIDSMTNPHSVAYETANTYGVPSLRRDVFLDADPHPKRIEKAFQQLVRIARRMGSAIGIAHPYPTTLAFLEANLESFESQGVKLVSVSELVTGTRQTPAKLPEPAPEPVPFTETAKLPENHSETIRPETTYSETTYPETSQQSDSADQPEWNSQKIIELLADLPTPESERMNFY